MRVSGFPGKGDLEVSFFPTAICEDECGARTVSSGRTDANGGARFRVRVPGTFLDRRNRHVYFRDGERVDVDVTWEGDDGESFAVASAESVIVRTHGAHRSPRPALAAAAGKPLPVPGSFRLAGSNGYTIYVFAVPKHESHGASVELIAAGRHAAVYYDAPAVVSETSIQSDLGDLGQISLTFNRSNRAVSVPCGRRPVRFDSGQYEGTFVFRGEEGFTSAEATTVPGDVSYLISGVCGKGFSEFWAGGPARGARLEVRNPGLGARLSIHKSKPGAAAEISASSLEYRDGISIDRVVGRWMPGADFFYDRRLRTATVRPPAPFSGSARFDRGRKAGQRWSGDLAVDLPGRADVPLVGPALRAFLTPSD